MDPSKEEKESCPEGIFLCDNLLVHDRTSRYLRDHRDRLTSSLWK